MNSLVQSEKVVGARTRYNLRVVETLVAARTLACVLGLDALIAAEGGRRKFTLREALAALVGSGEVKGKAAPSLSPEEVKAGLERILGEVERLRPAGLRRWEAGEGGVVEESQGEEELGLMYDEMVRASGLEMGVFWEVYLSWIEGAPAHFSPSKDC